MARRTSDDTARPDGDLLSARDAQRLQAVTAGLSAAATTADIADVIVNEGIPALAAATGIFAVLEGDELHFVRTIGYRDVFPERLGLDAPWPIVEAVRRKRMIELRDVSERRSTYGVPEEVWSASAKGTLVAVPLLVGPKAVGALGFTREESTRLSARERTLVETLARQAAQALERASLYETDRRARVQAEGLQRVASAVATAATLQDVAVAVTTEALDVLRADGVTVLLTPPRSGATADVLAAAGSISTYATDQPTVHLDAGTLTAAAIRARTSLYAESPDELASWPASAAVASRLGVGAVACVPQQVGERVGAISLVFAGPKRFLPEERTFLELLARACEQGLIRAELYEAEREARTRSELLHDLSAALSGALAQRDVATAFLERVLDYTGAGSGALMLPDAGGRMLRAAAIAGPGETRRRWLPKPLDADAGYLVTTAFREAKRCVATSRAELEEAFPATAANLGPAAKAAYALPLVVGGAPIGAFGVVWEEERVVDPEDELLLATMTDLCAQALERARLYDSEHRIALRLQRALLPDTVVQNPGVMIAARYEASSETMEVGGDWYDTYELPDGRIGVAVGDVVGHGIEAAASMGRLRSAFAALASEFNGPGELLSRLDRFAAGPSGVDFATACFAVLEPRTGLLRYASAGHPPMLLVPPRGETTWLEDGRSQPLYGAVDDDRAEASVLLEPGSLLLLYSDGLVERRGERLSAGLARLERAASALRELPVDEVCERVLADVRGGSEQTDDIVIVGLRLLPLGARAFRLAFPARPEELRSTRAAIRGWLADQGVDPDREHDLLLAVGEACANAVEHAYHGRDPGQVEIEIDRGTDVLVARVRDFGRWREPTAVVNRGRGTGIMKALSDDLSVDTGPAGTTVTIRLAPESAR